MNKTLFPRESLFAFVLLGILVSGDLAYAQTTSFTRDLKVGSTGQDVSALQSTLIESSHLNIAQPTGYYGNLTRSAVSQWQKSNGLPSTGYFGPLSRSKIRSAGARTAALAAMAAQAAQSQSAPAPTASDASSTASLSASQPSSSSIGGAVTGGSTSRRRTGSRHTPDYTSVSSMEPAHGSVDAARARGIKVVFARAMDGGTINSSSFSVTANGNPVPGSIIYNTNSNTAIFRPDSVLPANADIDVLISRDVKDSAGVGMLTDFNASFITSSSLESLSGISLGSASGYSLLALSLANTNPTIIRGGDLGTGAGSASSTPTTLTGSVHDNDSSYTAAATALNSAFIDSDSRVCDTTESGATEIGGRTFSPGVHCFTGAVTLNGTTTLSASGTFIFKLSDNLTTGSTAAVEVVNGAQPSAAYWIVNGSASIASSTRLLGTLMAKGAVSTGYNSTVDGRILSQSNVTTSASTTSSVPASIYCSRIAPRSATSATVGGVFSVAYVISNGSTLSGELNAGTCDVGVYFPYGSTATLTNATLHDALKRGVFVDAANATISSSTISEIGDHTNANTGVFSFGGTQTGIGIEAAIGSTGNITANNIYNYQKVGVVARALTNLFIRNNTITGMGSTTINAQIGLQLGTPAIVASTTIGNVTGNTITKNIYTPSSSAVGVYGVKMSGEDGTALTNTFTANNNVYENGIEAGADVFIP